MPKSAGLRRDAPPSARHCLTIPPVAEAGGTGRSAASLLLDDPTREGRLVVAPGIPTRGAPPGSVRDYQTVPSGGDWPQSPRSPQRNSSVGFVGSVANPILR